MVVACKAREMLPLTFDPLHLTPLPPHTHMHTTFFEGEPLGHSPHGNGQVKVLAGGRHGGRAGHPTLGTSPQDGPPPNPPSLLPSCCRLCGWPGSSPLWAALPPLLRGPVPWGRVPARLDGLPAAQLWVPPRPAVPGRPLCAPRPVPLPVPAWSHGSVPPNPPPSTAAPSCLAPATLPMGASLGLQDRNGQLPRPGAGARWGFCVLHPPGPLSPWVETAG